MSDLERAVLDHVDTRLAKRRPSGAELTVALRLHEGRNVVQLQVEHGERRARVLLAPEELDDVVRALEECRRLTLGVPQGSAAQRDVEALAGRGRKRRG